MSLQSLQEGTKSGHVLCAETEEECICLSKVDLASRILGGWDSHSSLIVFRT